MDELDIKLPDPKYQYVKSCDLKKTNVRFKIGTLEGERKKPTPEELLKDPILKYSGRNQACSDLWVVYRICDHKDDIGTLPDRTNYKAFSTRWNWNEWMTSYLTISNLRKATTLLLTVMDYDGPGRPVPVGGTSVRFFSNDGILQKGIIDLRVWPGVEAHYSDTPGQEPLEDDSNDQMNRLKKLVKKHNSGQMASCEWKDKRAFREIEVINHKEKRSSKFMYLTIEIPDHSNGADVDVIHWDPGTEAYLEAEKKWQKRSPLYDPDHGLENLYERKHHYLTRSARSGLTDKDQKPNAFIRDKLYRIMEYPPTKQLTNEEHDLIWKSRFYLCSHKKALTKFVKIVDWTLEGHQAYDLLQKWEPIDPQDALELFGPTITSSEVRYYAVERLSHASDEDLLSFLLQLVQALRYEPLDLNSLNILDDSHYSYESESSSDTGTFASNDPLPNENDQSSSKDSSIPEKGHNAFSGNPSHSVCEQKSLIERTFGSSQLDLATFLIKRACNNPILANFLYWYLHVECEKKNPEDEVKQESKVGEMYHCIMSRFKIALQQGTPKSKSTWQTICRQQHFMDNLVSIVMAMNKESGGRPKKIEKLQSLIANSETVLNGFSMTNIDPLPLPLDPSINIVGIIPEETTLFKSALEPCRLTFRTSNGGEYVTIFKHGDDLRQDQLIIGIIMLIDTLLQNENLDLKLTPYRVLATSYKHGLMQYIDSVSIAEILRIEGSICNFLRKNAPSPDDPLGISKDVMDNYVRSVAGYSVITYLLGIGDRHFDNLLLTKQGNFFHVDFGYILGRDPKPMPPLIKLTKEMLEGMGGQSSVQYKEFRKLCYTAFHQLRRHANLILNLFSLMVDANVPDIMLEPDKMVKKVEDRFCLSLSDEEAASHMQEIIDSSIGAVVATVVEDFHRLAQYMRK